MMYSEIQNLQCISYSKTNSNENILPNKIPILIKCFNLDDNLTNNIISRCKATVV